MSCPTLLAWLTTTRLGAPRVATACGAVSSRGVSSRAVSSRAVAGFAMIFGLAVSAPATTLGATLPEHQALSVLVVADAVNPNRLTPEELTEPSDFAPALQADDSGLNVSSVITVDSQCADDALTALEGASRPSVVLYFAHRAAKTCAGGDGQTRLVAGFEAGLKAGMGIVVFHHGLYGDLYTPGAKDSVLQLLGAESSGITWDTTTGQRVFIVGGDHFVASNGLTPEGEAALGAVDGVSQGTYPYFDNIPDERYPTTALLTQPDEQRVPLFATNSGGERLVGYALTRAGWQGRVVAYQSGEYQPHALDDRAGNNFQILANALYFAAFGAPQAPTGPAPSSEPTPTSEPASSAPEADSALGTSPETGETPTEPEPATGAPVPVPGGPPAGVPPSGVPSVGVPSVGVPPADTSGDVPPTVIVSPAPGAPPGPSSTSNPSNEASPAPTPSADGTAGQPRRSESGCNVAGRPHLRREPLDWAAALAIAGLVFGRARRVGRRRGQP